MKTCIPFLALMLLHAAASAFTVSPTNIELEPATRSTTFTVSNDGGRSPLTVRIRPRAWAIAADGVETLAATDQLLIYPPQTTIAPGRQQTFRLLVRSGPQDVRYYRLLVDNLGTDADPKGLRLKTGFNVPVFIEPRMVLPRLVVQRTAQGFVARNEGGGYELVRAVVVDGKNRSPIFKYLMPGSSLTLPAMHKLKPQMAVALETRRSGDVKVQ